nr:uncharacterized protein LOC105330535 [Crassostrea gigas]
MVNQITDMHIFQLLYLYAEIIRLFSLSIATQCRYDKYYNTKINNCTDCLPGYYGQNCRTSCRYPNYGVNCQEGCNCSKIACNHIIGCFDNAFDGHDKNNGHLLIIGLSVGIGVALIIVAFFIITARNRRLYTRQIRENAHYIGSVVTEHSMTTNLYNPSEPCTRHCSESEATDSGVYMLAGTLRYEHINLE